MISCIITNSSTRSRQQIRTIAVWSHVSISWHNCTSTSQPKKHSFRQRNNVSLRKTTPTIRRQRFYLSSSASFAFTKHNDNVNNATAFKNTSTIQFPYPTIVLYLSSSVLPEPNISAAGVRTEFFIEQLINTKGIQAIHYGTGAKLQSKQEQETEQQYNDNDNNNNNSTSSSNSANNNKDNDNKNSTTTTISNLQNLGNIYFHHVPPNSTKEMKQFLIDSGCLLSPSSKNDNGNTNNDNDGTITQNNSNVIVIFDRFYSEEIYSFHIHKLLPNATFILDMQDMHSLRLGRQEQLYEKEKEQKEKKKKTMKDDDDNDVFKNIPVHYYPSLVSESSLSSKKKSTRNKNTLQRELASIYRCDLTLVCSIYEYNLLTNRYTIPKKKLCLASYFMDTTGLIAPITEMIPTLPPPTTANSAATPTTITNTNTASDSNETITKAKTKTETKDSDEGLLSSVPPFHRRKDFTFIGGFRHLPNIDAIKQLKILWPKLRKTISNIEIEKKKQQNDDNNDNSSKETITLPELHIYGALCTDALHKQLHSPEDGFYIMGYAYNLENTLANYRVMLIPLRFGAGIKGKIIDSWKCNVPVVTTLIGSEGMTLQEHFCQKENETVEISNNNSNSSSSNRNINIDDDNQKEIDWGGSIIHNEKEFIGKSIELYYNTNNKWELSNRQSKNILKQLFDINDHWYNRVLVRIFKTNKELYSLRKDDYIKEILLFSSNRYTEYFSKWIELKNSIPKEEKK